MEGPALQYRQSTPVLGHLGPVNDWRSTFCDPRIRRTCNEDLYRVPGHPWLRTGDHLRNSPIPDSLLKSTLSQIIPAVAVAVSVVVVCVSVLFRGVSPLLNPHSDLAILTRRIRRFRAGARDRYSNTFEVIP